VFFALLKYNLCMDDMQSSHRQRAATRTRIIAGLGRYSLFLAAYFLVGVSYWLNRYFGVPDLDQILYHLNVGAEGLVSTDPVLLKRFIRWCVIAPVLVLLLTIWFERKRFAARWQLAPALRTAFPLLLLCAVMVHWVVQTSAVTHVLARFGPDYFGSHYVAPDSVAMHADKPKNLVLIYVESLEASYNRKDLLGANLIAPLEAIEGQHFAQFRQAPGTGWTIAALVATQCALPLKRVTLYDENTQGEAVRSFLPNATCLGDILAQHGYRNVFMGGASPTFAGKGKFLHSHGYHEVYGKEDWVQAGALPDQLNGWGLYDGRLLAKARIKLQELEAAKQPFNLTLLTVNTHEPNGHLSQRCIARGFHGFAGVVGCTAQHVAEFLEFMEQSGYMANTNVVILGDHLARKNPLTKRLGSVPERTIFNLVLSRHAPIKATDEIVHFDLLPTILALNGFTIEGGRLGLGYSAYDAQTRPPRHRFEDMQSALMNRSDAYLALWAPAQANAHRTIAQASTVP
jgi:phosphoglycerol transferase